MAMRIKKSQFTKARVETCLMIGRDYGELDRGGVKTGMGGKMADECSWVEIGQ